jgi:hypothetical protein
MCVKCKQQQERSRGGGGGLAGWSAVGDLEVLEED